MKLYRIFYLMIVVLGLHAGVLCAETHVVTTTSTLASLVREVAGEGFDIHYVASPKRDLHFVSPTPKDVLKLKKADMFVHHGLDAEPWRVPLVNAAGNLKFIQAGPENIDVSDGIELLEVPETLSRQEGDIHAFGNPHYWTDPVNAGIMAEHIAAGFSVILPGRAAEFKANAQEFQSRLETKMKEWRETLKPLQGQKVVTYHRSLSYFLKRFGMESIGELEPKPGISPSPRHLAELIRKMKENQVKLIVQEYHYEDSAAKKTAEDTSARIVKFSLFVGNPKETLDYISMTDFNVRALRKAFDNEKE